MGAAFKCDRCGELQEGGSEGDWIGSTRCPHLKVSFGLSLGRCDGEKEPFDLCLKCKKQIAKAILKEFPFCPLSTEDEGKDLKEQLEGIWTDKKEKKDAN